MFKIKNIKNIVEKGEFIMKKTNNKGFSLVELIIVVAIMAILIGVLAPQYIKYVEKSRISADEDTMDSLTKAVQTAVTDDDYYEDIAEGHNLEISGTGTVINSDSLKAPIEEYYGDITKTKFKSKEYKNATCTISVIALKNDDGQTTGYAAEREVSGSLTKDGKYR